MKNYQFFWPTIVALALSCTVVSCYNSKVEKDSLPTTENTFVDSVFDSEQYELDSIITVEDYLEQMNNDNNDLDSNAKTR